MDLPLLSFGTFILEHPNLHMPDWISSAWLLQTPGPDEMLPTPLPVVTDYTKVSMQPLSFVMPQFRTPPEFAIVSMQAPAIVKSHKFSPGPLERTLKIG